MDERTALFCLDETSFHSASRYELLIESMFFLIKTNSPNKLNFYVGFHLNQNRITVFGEKKRIGNYNY